MYRNAIWCSLNSFRHSLLKSTFAQYQNQNPIMRARSSQPVRRSQKRPQKKSLGGRKKKKVKVLTLSLNNQQSYALEDGPDSQLHSYCS
mmetsp:Transcript_31316/g.70492  ORF Transcript_31316/g.70492 Transcript_31316/m.70492 type:complete len:89 (-) Transcript_31316:747-1013(-)